MMLTMPGPYETHQSEKTLIRTFPVGPLQCNCTFIGDLSTKKAILIDPGGDAKKIRELLSDFELELTHIYHTHAHFDHFLASGKLKDKTGARLHLHKADEDLWNRLEYQCQLFHVPYEPAPPPDEWLEHEAEIGTGSLAGKALHTPGHTPGSMCFHFDRQQLLIAGDTLFRRSVGRTDLWGGSFEQLENSIRSQLYVLDEETQVVPGHGPMTSIGYEARFNPIVNGVSK